VDKNHEAWRLRQSRRNSASSQRASATYTLHTLADRSDGIHKLPHYYVTYVGLLFRAAAAAVSGCQVAIANAT